jgi:hypothetical protein
MGLLYHLYRPFVRLLIKPDMGDRYEEAADVIVEMLKIEPLKVAA